MLTWPDELAQTELKGPRWTQAGTNICLDFHGDPQRAQLVVFSDGNHHMALAETMQAFLQRNLGVGDIFYLTTPPSVLLQFLETGRLCLGNLCLSVVPHIMISPPVVLDRVVATGRMLAHQPFMRSLGNVLLVRKGNPKSIHSVADLTRPDVKLFLSNPDTESASYQVYTESLKALSGSTGVNKFLSDSPESSTSVVYGERIHHREAPQCLVEGRADAAFLYYHLALRYTRIFPEWFEMVAVDDTPSNQPAAGNIVSRFHAGLIDDGGKWGRRFLEFLISNDVERIYQHHGLQRT